MPETRADVELGSKSIGVIKELCDSLSRPRIVVCRSDNLVRVPCPAELRDIAEWPTFLTSDVDATSLATLMQLRSAALDDEAPVAARITTRVGVEHRLTMVNFPSEGLLCIVVSDDQRDASAELGAVDTSPCSIIINPQGVIKASSGGASELLGIPESESVGVSLLDRIHPNHMGEAIEAFVHVLTAAGTARTIRVQLDLTAGSGPGAGTWRWFEAVLHAHPDGEEDEVVVSLADIDDDVAARAQLEASEHRFRVLAESMPVGVFNQSADKTWANATLREILGCDAMEHGWSPLSPEEMQAPGVAAFLSAILEDNLEGSTSPTSLGVSGRDGSSPRNRLINFSHRRRGERQVRITVLQTSDAKSLIGAVVDVTTERLHAAELAEQARTDPLTGLANRKAIDEKLKALGSGLAGALFIDVNDFKEINDRHGHGAGDELLRQLGERLRSGTRGDDLVARLGGDEFLVVSSDATIEVLCRMAKRLEVDLAVPARVGGAVLVPSLSIGVAHGHASRSDELLRRADIAMYAQKRTGRHGFCLADDELMQAENRRRELTESLPEAIRRGFPRAISSLIGGMWLSCQSPPERRPSCPGWPRSVAA